MGNNIAVTAETARRPTTPCLPPALLRRLHGLTRERAKTMTLVETERETLVSLLPAYRAYLEPGPRAEISALLTRLRAHYFVPDVPDALAQALADDWADDMALFPLWAVKAACDRYRRSEASRAPRPADIISFCKEEIQDEHQEVQEIELALASEPATAEPTRVTAEQVGAIIDRAGLRPAMDELEEWRKRRSGG